RATVRGRRRRTCRLRGPGAAEVPAGVASEQAEGPAGTGCIPGREARAGRRSGLATAVAVGPAEGSSIRPATAEGLAHSDAGSVAGWSTAEAAGSAVRANPGVPAGEAGPATAGGSTHPDPVADWPTAQGRSAAAGSAVGAGPAGAGGGEGGPAAAGGSTHPDPVADWPTAQGRSEAAGSAVRANPGVPASEEAGPATAGGSTHPDPVADWPTAQGRSAAVLASAGAVGPDRRTGNGP